MGKTWLLVTLVVIHQSMLGTMKLKITTMMLLVIQLQLVISLN